jgi:hypothetical protein
MPAWRSGNKQVPTCPVLLSEEDIFKLPPREVEQLFGKKVASMVEEARGRPPSSRFRSKLGRLMAERHMHDKAVRAATAAVAGYGGYG